MSLGPDARSLIAAADGADDPTSADEARIRAKIAARLAVAAGTGIAATTAAKTASAGAGTAVTTSLAAKIAIGVAVVSATTVGGTALYERTRDPLPVHASASARPIETTAPSETAAPIETAIAIPDPPAPTVTAHAADTVTPAPIAARPTVKPVAKPSTPTSATTPSSVSTSTNTNAPDALFEEAGLLRAAHAALARGDGAAAMLALDEHARRFPRGTLAEEREAARVLALCARGRASEARASASAFVAANPRSPFAAQVRRSCATKNE